MARRFLKNHGFSIANKTAKVKAPVAEDFVGDNSPESSDRDFSTQSAYEPRENLTLNIDINYYSQSGQYFASADWMWDSQTLGPLDGVALSYKENSWAVPPNGYSSTEYADLDVEAPWANGYAWRYHDHNHTIDNDGAGEWQSASLEIQPYSDAVDPEQRYIWLVYTQTSSPYGGYVNGLSLGYGILGVDVTGVSMTYDTWKRDKSGQDLKLSQADADFVNCC
ncbi:hypothetical protein [Haloarchaeobius sp. DFWS5]|uniref:hypothetical protein n=1 Tax=Haloarchaeobius sp. DFWS5 TaxID=3446114 RepID=UPI003EBDE0E5